MKPVSDLLACKFENVCLKIQAVQLQLQQMQQTGQKLVQEREDLLREMRESVGADPKAPYDMPSKTFRPVIKPPLSAPTAKQARRSSKLAAVPSVAAGNVS